MKTHMVSTTFKQLEVFKSIVFSILKATHRVFNSFMMNNLFWFKKAFKTFFHYKTMLHNVTCFSCKRMFRTIYINIAITVKSNTTFPIRMFFATFNKFPNYLFTPFRKWFTSFKLITTFSRTEFCISFSSLIRFRIEKFTTNFALSYVGICFASIKMITFIRTKFVTTLLKIAGVCDKFFSTIDAIDFNHKRPSLLLSHYINKIGFCQSN